MSLTMYIQEVLFDKADDSVLLLEVEPAFVFFYPEEGNQDD
jgi:hypothetical protein